MLKQLIDQIKDTMNHLDSGEEVDMIKSHFANTITHIKYLQSRGIVHNTMVLEYRNKLTTKTVLLIACCLML